MAHKQGTVVFIFKITSPYFTSNKANCKEPSGDPRAI